jgi:hypothetical protein
MPSTDTQKVCPLGDTTSIGVAVGYRIDLVTIFLVEEDEREEDFPPTWSILRLSTTILVLAALFGFGL